MDTHIIPLSLCTFLVLLGLFVSIELAIYATSKIADENDERDPYLDSEGNHIYYERSLIEKNDFIREHPQIKDTEVRTFTRLFHEIRNSLTIFSNN